jgi:hypothetical protein
MTTDNGASRDRRGRYISNAKFWAAFDALPKSMRVVLANAVFDWSPVQVYGIWQTGRWKNTRAFARELRQWDREQIAEERESVWGITPQPKRRHR